MELEPNSNLSQIFIKKYEQIRILGEGNYGKAILVKSLIDKVIIYFNNLYLNIVFSRNKINRFVQIDTRAKKRRAFRGKNS